MVLGTNATGWAELYDGQLWNSAFVMFNTALGGAFVFILYFAFQAMLFYKTRNPTIMFIVGVIFTYMAITLTLVPGGWVWYLFGLIVLQFAWMIYAIFWK